MLAWGVRRCSFQDKLSGALLLEPASVQLQREASVGGFRV